jgi:hypothetical protein
MVDKQRLLRSAGIDSAAGVKNGKYLCPKCDEHGVSVNKNTGRARCYKGGGCGWHYPLRRDEAVANPLQTALNTLRDNWKRALLTDKGKKRSCGFRKRILHYLLETRGIGLRVLEASPIGMVPPSYSDAAKQIIASARRSIEDSIMDREEREDNLSRFDEGFTKELLTFCGEFGTPDRKTGVTPTSREGWIVFFYEDGNGNVVSLNFRSLDLDEEGGKKVRTWMPLNRRGVFNPIDGGYTLGEKGDRVLVMEGEFNQLQYLSAHERAYGDNWLDETSSCVTAGASSGVDISTLWKVLGNIGAPDQTVCAVVNEDKDAAGHKVTQQIAEGGFTYHFALSKKDMDDFIKAKADDKDALREVVQLAASAPMYFCPIDDARARLDMVRSNFPDFANGVDGKGNPLKAPQHLLSRKIYEFVERDVRTRSRLFLTAYPYIYRRDTHELVKFDADSPTATEFLKQYGLMACEQATTLVTANLQSFLLNKKNVEDLAIHQLGCILPLSGSKKGKYVCFVNKGDGQMFRITAESFEVVQNGTDDVFMLDEALAPWPNLTDSNVECMEEIRQRIGKACLAVTDTPLCLHLTSLYEKQALSQEQCVQMSFARFLFHWVANSCELWPIEFNTGLQNAGKSTGFEKQLTMLYGLSSDGEGQKGDNLPPDRRGLIAGLTNSSIKLYDNIDSVDFNRSQSSYLDIFCGCATGMNASMAMLYKNNIQLTYKLKTHLKLTARTCPIQRADAMRRVIQLAIRKPSPTEHVSKDILIRKLMKERDECLLEILVRLQNVVRAYEEYHTKTYLKVSEMPEYEEWTYRLAEYEGRLPQVQEIWKRYAEMYGDMIQDSNPMAFGMKLWIGRYTGEYYSNVGRKVSVATLWAEFNEVHEFLTGVPSTYKSASSFGKQISKYMAELKALGYQENGYTGGKRRVWFDPCPEQIDECKRLYKDLSDARDRRYIGPCGSLDPAYPELEEV